MDDRNVILANFQACTAIDDYSVCLAILEQHNWDLQNAVNAALTQVQRGWNSPDRNSPDTVGIRRTSFCLLKILEFPGQVLFDEKLL